MKQNKSTFKSGFTLIELSISTVFVSMLLITIAFLTLHIMSVYQKGLAVKSINSTGRELIDDFSRTLAGSNTVDVAIICGRANLSATAKDRCIADGAQKFLYQQNYMPANNLQVRSTSQRLSGTEENNIATSGVFCTGYYSYVWNTGYILGAYNWNNDGSAVSNTNGAYYQILNNQTSYAAKLKYNLAGGNVITKSNFRLMRVQDPERNICASNINTSYDLIGNTYTVTNITDAPVDLIANSEDNLAIYDLKLAKPIIDTDSMKAFYAGSFKLATVRGGVDVTASGDYCTEKSSNLATDFAYCAINEFNFAIRATGESPHEH